MSISSDRLKILTEEQVGKSGEVFGRRWKVLYKVISEEEDKLTEESYLEALSECEFKNPEYVGFIALLCPPLCTYITDRILGEKMKEFYKFILYTWYIMLILSVVQFFIDQKIPSSGTISLFIMCMVYTSWSFREWCKEYNKLELIYHVLKKVEKI
jgi:hypothetical protein